MTGLARRMAGEPIRLALIGAGAWGANYLTTAPRVPGVSLDIVCDPCAKARVSARELAPRVEAVERLEEVFARGGDGVGVATPPASHVSVATRCFDAGLHVLVEKPLAVEESGARAVLAAAERADRVLLVGHLMLHHPAVENLIASVRGGDLGQVVEFYAERTSRGAQRSTESPLWSLGPHDVATLLALLPDPVATVRMDGSSSASEASLFAAIGGGVEARFRWSRSSSTLVRKIHVRGTRGEASLDEREQVLTTPTGSWSFEGGEAPLLRQFRHFAECIRGEATPYPAPELAAEVVRFLSLAQSSQLAAAPLSAAS